MEPERESTERKHCVGGRLQQETRLERKTRVTMARSGEAWEAFVQDRWDDFGFFP